MALSQSVQQVGIIIDRYFLKDVPLSSVDTALVGMTVTDMVGFFDQHGSTIMPQRVFSLLLRGLSRANPTYKVWFLSSEYIQAILANTATITEASNIIQELIL
jgi:hypothetical protein